MNHREYSYYTDSYIASHIHLLVIYMGAGEIYCIHETAYSCIATDADNECNLAIKLPYIYNNIYIYIYIKYSFTLHEICMRCHLHVHGYIICYSCIIICMVISFVQCLLNCCTIFI